MPSSKQISNIKLCTFLLLLLLPETHKQSFPVHNVEMGNYVSKSHKTRPELHNPKYFVRNFAVPSAVTATTHGSIDRRLQINLIFLRKCFVFLYVSVFVISVTFILLEGPNVLMQFSEVTGRVYLLLGHK